MKFYNSEFNISKKYAEELMNRSALFARKTKTKKNIHLTFISTYGLKENIYSRQLIQNSFDISCLFKKL